MNCREFVEFLMDYLDGGLPAEQAATFNAHMDGCPSCVTYLETYRETIRLGKCVCECSDDVIPDDVPEKLVAAILAARRTGRDPD